MTPDVIGILALGFVWLVALTVWALWNQRRPRAVPRWFRRGARYLVKPEQCVTCGAPSPAIREPFAAFCSEDCAEVWHRPRMRDAS